MEKPKSYTIFCRKGQRKDECIIIQQQKILCVECPYVGYFPRNIHTNNEETENKEETENDVKVEDVQS
jgi:hypothetical protein